MNNNIIVWFVFLVLIGGVSSELGGFCIGNVLFWTNHLGVDRHRECAVLHTSSGVMYRGECQPYKEMGGGAATGAACYRVEGEVTHEYIMDSKSNASAILNPVSTTTTTLQPIFNIECPKCPSVERCEDCSSYRVDVRILNASLNTCIINRDEYKSKYVSRVSKETMNTIIAGKDSELKDTKVILSACEKDKDYLEDWNSYYSVFAICCGLLVCALIYIWVKAPKLEDPDVGGFGV